MELTITEKEPAPTVCLNMIVKNESKIITRLLKSVETLVDCYCICDTGSTDNTIHVISEFFGSRNIPGKIVSEPFINFEYNRNFALRSCVGMSDYVLLLDADMVLQIKPSFDKYLLLKYDSFLILQGSESFYYHNMRIIKNTGQYKYEGVTHEYINTPPNTTSYNIDKNMLFINDIGDGGSKSNKFERDVELLKKGIEEHPNHDRYHFYLANSYFDLGRNEEAIPIYKKRIEIGGWDQEVWYSYYRIGLAYKRMGKMEQAIAVWLDGYNFLPSRIENLYEIIEHYRLVGKCKLALVFYNLAKDVLTKVKDKDSYLFLNNDVYTYKLDYELSIISSYVGIKNINDSVIAIFNRCNDQSILDNTLSNMKFYKEILVPIGLIEFTKNISHFIGNKERKLFSSSACILPYKEGYLMNMRMVNYRIDSNGNYHDCDDYIITVNNYIELSDDFTVIEEKLLGSVFDERKYIGYEDIRIFPTQNNEGLHFVGTGLHKNGNLGICSGHYDKNTEFIEGTEIKPTFSHQGCEKNWVFVDYLGSPHIVYNWYPLHICKINLASRTLESVCKKDNVPNLFKRIRGSTNGFKYKNEIWFITHMVSYEQPRHYYHVFLVFDSELNLLRYSAPFKFEGECIEYCIGLIVEDFRVIVPYSTWDRTSKIAIYNKSYIDEFTKYTEI
jgi:tetratricopeptide (TPR) repeat protein